MEDNYYIGARVHFVLPVGPGKGVCCAADIIAIPGELTVTGPNGVQKKIDPHSVGAAHLRVYLPNGGVSLLCEPQFSQRDELGKTAGTWHSVHSPSRIVAAPAGAGNGERAKQMQ